MGMRFRKSIKIAPGVKINVGKKSAGISVGGKYGGISVNSKTGARTRVSAPGTGLSYTTKIGSSTRSTSSRAGTAAAHGSDLHSAPAAPAPADLRAQAQKLQSNLKVVSIGYPILAVIFAILGFAVPVLFLFAALFVFLRIKLVKKYKAEIPQLTERADQLDLIGEDLSAIEKAEKDLVKTKSAALYFLALAQILDHSETILQKAPALSAYQSMDECRSAICDLYDTKIKAILKSDFEKTYKHLFELKTQKGLDAAIEKFQAPYAANLENMAEDCQTEYQSYVDTLRGVQLVEN